MITLCIAASLAEMLVDVSWSGTDIAAALSTLRRVVYTVSLASTALLIADWAAMLSTPKYSALSSYLTGWLGTVGNWL